MAFRMSIALLTWAMAEATVSTHVWPLNAENFTFPEFLPGSGLNHLEGRDNFGIAFGGGGYRGMALAHGFTRALRTTKILDRAFFLTASSGSAWFGWPFYFQATDDLDTYLGQQMEPESLTPSTLTSAHCAGTGITKLKGPIKPYPDGFKPEMAPEEKPRFLGMFDRETLYSVLAEGSWPTPILDVIEAVFGGLAKFLDTLFGCMLHWCVCVTDDMVFFGPLARPLTRNLWTMMTEKLMEPFDVTKSGSTWCHSTMCSYTKTRLGDNVHIYEAQDVNHSLPFFISQAALVNFSSGTDQATNPLTSTPVENTLLYSGVPVGGDLDGIFVEPFATSSAPAGAIDANKVEVVRVENVLQSGDLTQVEGWTTVPALAWPYRQTLDYISMEGDCKLNQAKSLVPEISMWSPSQVDSHGVPTAQSMPIAEAGLYDDIGHLPLLRRKVKKMLLFDSASIPPSGEKFNGTDKVTLDANVYIKAAFGVGPPRLPPGAPNSLSPVNYLTVFDSKDFDPLWEKMQALKKANKPLVVRGNFSVVDNPHFGIEGGWQVEIVWVISTPVDDFFLNLPNETRHQLLKKNYFPNYGANDPTSHFELNAISQYASWLVKEAVVKEVNAMLDGTSAVVI